MAKVEMDVRAKDGWNPSAATWERFLLRLVTVTNDLAAEFPELTLGLPVVKGRRQPHRRVNGPDPYDPTTDDGTVAHDGLDRPSYGD